MTNHATIRLYITQSLFITHSEIALDKKSHLDKQRRIGSFHTRDDSKYNEIQALRFTLFFPLFIKGELIKQVDICSQGTYRHCNTSLYNFL